MDGLTQYLVSDVYISYAKWSDVGRIDLPVGAYGLTANQRAVSQ
jgi:hypothetical protein